MQVSMDGFVQLGIISSSPQENYDPFQLQKKLFVCEIFEVIVNSTDRILFPLK